MDAPVSESIRYSEFLRLTRPNDEADREAIHTRSRRHEHVRSTLFRALGEPKADLGILQRMPNEILCNIARELPVKTAFNFSHANRAARSLLNSCVDYRLVGEHGVECVWALMRTKLADSTWVTGIHSALINEECISCGRFGALIFLPGTERVCLSCVETKKEFHVHFLKTVRGWFSALGKELPVQDPFGTFECPPGFEEFEESDESDESDDGLDDGLDEPKKDKGPTKFISGFHAIRFARAHGIRVGGSDGVSSEGYFEPNDLEPLDGAGDPALQVPAVDIEFLESGQIPPPPPPPPTPPPVQVAEDEQVQAAEVELAPTPLVASCMLPHFNRTLNLALRGRSCRGCRRVSEDLGTDESFAARDRVYSVNEFWKHFKTCEEAMRLMASDEEPSEEEDLSSDETADELETLREETDEELEISEEETEEMQETYREETDEERVSDSEYVTADEW